MDLKRKIKRTLFLAKLNRAIKEFGATVKLYKEEPLNDIIQIQIGKQFVHQTIGEHNYNEFYIKKVRQEIINQKMRQNLNG